MTALTTSPSVTASLSPRFETGALHMGQVVRLARCRLMHALQRQKWEGLRLTFQHHASVRMLTIQGSNQDFHAPISALLQHSHAQQKVGVTLSSA